VKEIDKDLFGDRRQLADRLDAQSVQAVFSLLPNAADSADRQGGQEFRNTLRSN